MNTRKEQIWAQRHSYRTLWSRVYAPLRTHLAGRWQTDEAPDRIELRLNQDGRFLSLNLGEQKTCSGSYTVVGKDGDHYLVLEDDCGGKDVFRIDEMDKVRLVLADDEARCRLRFSRQAETGRPDAA